MSDQQVKEFFSSVLEGGPADRLDLDRAVAVGRRRRRIRTATTLASAAAVLAVVGALVVSALPDDGRTDLGGPTTSATASATGSARPEIIAGTADDWARALEPYLPAGTEAPAVYAIGGVLTKLPGQGIFRAAYHYERDGRTTALVIAATATIPQDKSQAEIVEALTTFMTPLSPPKVKVVQADSGPVVIGWPVDGKSVSASSVRANGIVVSVQSWNADTNASQVLEGSGQPALIDDVDVLVTLAAAVPLPIDLVTTATPTPTVEPSTSEPIALGPGPTMLPSIEPLTGLRGVLSDGVCPTTASADEPAALPIVGEPLRLRICPPLGWPASFGTQPVDLSTADGFKRLLDLLGSPDQPFTPPTPSPDPTIQYACPAKAQFKPTVFVVTSTGTYRLDLPSYDVTPDGCTFIQEDVLTALMAALGHA